MLRFARAAAYAAVTKCLTFQANRKTSFTRLPWAKASSEWTESDIQWQKYFPALRAVVVNA